MKTNKSPGFNGYTIDILQVFLVDIRALILQSINHGYRNGFKHYTEARVNYVLTKTK